MKIEDIRDIQIKIREMYPPSELSPEILQQIIFILLEYQNKYQKQE